MLDQFTDEQLREGARKPRTRAVIEQAASDQEEALARYVKIRDDSQAAIDQVEARITRLRNILEATAGERVL